mgnify:CR=1
MFISIHSLRMEGDIVAMRSRVSRPIISIHSLRMEGDISANLSSVFSTKFQSTPSAWRETIAAARRGRMQAISIHSLRMEGDHRCVI